MPEKKPSDDDLVRIGVDLNKDLSNTFRKVKTKLGIESNADVVRWLINWYYEKIVSRSE